uniref:ATP-dependent Clp protease n=1 Tax=Babesia gibsoni TaxID=33632 RepID=A0A6M8NUT3_BABGI|nr:ATP-dependent Clp protease [Babesia gibsoni]
MFIFINNKFINSLEYMQTKTYFMFINNLNIYNYFLKFINSFSLIYLKYKIEFTKANYINYTLNKYNNITFNKKFNKMTIIGHIFNNKLYLNKYIYIFKKIINLSIILYKYLIYKVHNKKYLLYLYKILNKINLKLIYYLFYKNIKIINTIIPKLNKKLIFFYFNKIISKIILNNFIYIINNTFITNLIYINKNIYNINYYLYNIYILNKFIIYNYNSFKINFIDNINYTKFNIYNTLFLNKYFQNKKVQSNKIIYTFYNLINKFIFGQYLIIKKLTTYLSTFLTFSKVKPLGSFLLCGPSGTGKTEIVKLITNYIYNSSKNLIQIDMSEYKEQHSISKLIGSPPGYIGHDEGGNLINKINLYPNSVILFDEIEKANKNIFSIFLQILDEGILTDSKGNSCKFNKSLIFFTSNLGSKIFTEINKGEMFNTKYYSKIKEEMNNYFKPEFINRLNDIIIFNPLLSKYLYIILDKYIYNSNYNNKIFLNNIVKSLISLISYSSSQGSRFCINNLNKLINNINLFKLNKILYTNTFIKYIIF